MKRALFLSLLFGMLGSLQAQTGVITLLHNGQASFFYQPNADAALNSIVTNNAQAGDTIILPGGEVGPGASISIDKPLTIIGAGIYPTGTAITGITTMSISGGQGNAFNISAEGMGSRFEGIRFSRLIRFNSGVSNITFSRCDIASGMINSGMGYSSPTGLVLSQCIIRSGISMNPGLGLTMSNCILEGSLSFGSPSNGQIDQCVFLNVTTSTVGINSGVTYTNCAFVSTSTSGMTINNASTYDHCLFAPINGSPLVSFGSDPVLIGGQQSQTITNNPTGLFTDVGAVDAFNYDYDFTPAPGSALLTNGVDGQNIGLYGPETTGWKNLAIPSNPHWTQFTPNGNINTNGGTIEVHIAAEAQQN